MRVTDNKELFFLKLMLSQLSFPSVPSVFCSTEKKPSIKAFITVLLVLCLPGWAYSEPIHPRSDDEIIEVLPASSGGFDQDRRLRKQLAAQPENQTLAILVARRYLERARQAGDPRFAGLALAALKPWDNAATMPSDILLLRATLQQYLHEFDNSVANLRLLLARPDGQHLAQAWLILATVLRVQGHYAESDEACRRVGESGVQVYSNACLAENAALRGETAAARKTFSALLADARLPDDARSWLLTSLAELEVRDGHAVQAEAAFRAALKLESDAYAATDFADFLIDQGRPVESLSVLKDLTRTDAVLLRLAIAGTLSSAPAAARDAAEMRDRIAAANERPDAKIFHGREQAMFALQIDHAPQQALALARGDVELQREPIDILVLARAARASGNSTAIDEVRRLKATLPLHDLRIDALL